MAKVIAKGVESPELDEIEVEPEFKKITKLSDKILMAHEDNEISLTVSRKAKTGRKVTFLFEIGEYEDLPTLQTLLRDEYSGGEFLIEGRYASGGWAVKESLSIEAPKSKTEKTQQTGDFQSVLLAMQENSARASEESRNMMMQMQQQAMTSQQSQLTMVVELLKTQQNQPVPSGPTMADMMGMLVGMKELSGGDDKMDILIKGMELGQNNSSGDENLLQTAIKTLGPPIASMTEKLQSAQPTPAATPQNPVAPPLTTEVPKDSDVNLMTLTKFKPYIELLLNAAAQNGDADIYAHVLLDNFGSDLIKDIIVDDENYAKLFAYIPKAVEHKAWFDNLRKIVIHYIESHDGQNEQKYYSKSHDGQNEKNNVSGETSDIEPNGDKQPVSIFGPPASPSRSENPDNSAPVGDSKRP